MSNISSDRDRRMIGDRIIALGERFVQVDASLGPLHEEFVRAHEAFVVRLESRQMEEVEDRDIRRVRDDAAARGRAVYAACWRMLPVLVAPEDPRQPLDDAALEVVRRAFFPGGRPSAIATTPQLTLDALTHLEMTMRRLATPAFPEPLRRAVAEARAQLHAAIREVTRDHTESRYAVEAHVRTREVWMRAYRALALTTRGLLVRAGKERNISFFFPKRASRSGAGDHDQAEAAVAIEPQPAGTIEAAGEDASAAEVVASPAGDRPDRAA